jgi:hypothetical protein
VLRAGGETGARGPARRDRDPRVQRLPDHPVPLAGDQRPQGRVRRLAGESRPATARDHARDPARGRRRLPRPVQDHRRRPPRCSLPLVGQGDDDRGLDSGLPVARGGRGGRLPRLLRELVSTSAQPGRRLPDCRHDPVVRHDALERQEHVPELPALPHAAAEQGVQVGLGAVGQERRDRGDQPRRGSSREGSRDRPRDLRRRLPDAVDDRRRDRRRHRRRSLDGPAADREPGPREPVRGRARPCAAPVHLLQQVPDQLHREPARMLRAEPVRLPGGDGSADPLGVRG